MTTPNIMPSRSPVGFNGQRFHLGISVHPAVSPLELTLRVVCLKWIPTILRLLAVGDRRFNQLLSAIPGIAHKVLIDQLRELEQQGVIHREAKAGGYRRVHYNLTESGRQLLPIIHLMEEWGRQRQGRQNEGAVSAPDPQPTNRAVRSVGGALPP